MAKCRSESDKPRLSPETITARQTAVRDLRGNLDLRETMALAGSDLRGSVNPDALVDWATALPSLIPRFARAASVALPLLFALGMAIWWSLRPLWQTRQRSMPRSLQATA